VFWHVMSCSLVYYQQFTGACYLHHQDRRMKVTVACSSETLATIHQTIRRHIVREINLHSNCRENLKRSNGVIGKRCSLRDPCDRYVMQQQKNCCGVFSMRSVPKLYNEQQLRLRESPETEVRKVGGWCEMASSLRGREPGGRGTSTGEDSRMRRLTKCCSELRNV
jgi:hypothetical protein